MEEASISHFNQAYDQEQAKRDRAATRQLLDMARPKIKGRIDQWQLIAIISTALKNLPGDIWTRSFFSVNLHPHHRLSFEDWIQKIAPYVRTGETAYLRTNEDSYYNAMPAVWKRMSEEKRRRVIAIIDDFVGAAPEGKSGWGEKANVLRLVEFCPLKSIPQLRVCHMVAKTHPEVMVGARDVVAEDVEEAGDGSDGGEGDRVEEE